MMKLLTALIFSAIALSAAGNAMLIDLDDYIIQIDSGGLGLNFAFGDRNESTGNYSAMASMGGGNRLTTLALIESEGSTNFDEENLSAKGFEPIKKPYPGLININKTDDSVAYLGAVKDNLKLAILFSQYQDAINMLPSVKVITREEYQAQKSDELLSSLT